MCARLPAEARLALCRGRLACGLGLTGQTLRFRTSQDLQFTSQALRFKSQALRFVSQALRFTSQAS